MVITDHKCELRDSDFVPLHTITLQIDGNFLDDMKIIQGFFGSAERNTILGGLLVEILVQEKIVL